MEARRPLLRERRNSKPVPEFRVRRCPMVGHQATWCRFLCTPIEGRGLCGREAPHGLVSRYREAIRDHKNRREGAA